MDKYNEILNFLNEVQYVLSQILSSGFKTYHEYIIKELDRLSIIAESYGLEYAGEKLNLLSEQLENKRHSFNFDFMMLTKESCKLNEYCLLCRKELQILKAEAAIKN